MASVFYILDFVSLIIFYTQPVDTQFFFSRATVAICIDCEAALVTVTVFG